MSIATNPSTMHTFTMPEAQAQRIHQLTKSQIGAVKNWMASAVERGDLARAQELVIELRCLEELFARFNIDAKYDIARATQKELVTSHFVAQSR